MQFIGGWFYVGEEKIMQIELYKVSESNNILIKFNGINLILFFCCFTFPTHNCYTVEYLWFKPLSTYYIMQKLHF